MRQWGPRHVKLGLSLAEAPQGIWAAVLELVLFVLHCRRRSQAKGYGCSLDVVDVDVI